jgi:hypothetical protein
VLICDRVESVSWRPDFSSSGQASPDWTRLECAGEVLANGLEWVEWEDEPVQVILCEQCGCAGCAEGGRIHLSRLGDHVIWSAPHERNERWAPAPAVERHGAVAIPGATWDVWARVPRNLPATQRRDLFAAWRGEEALDEVREVADWFAAAPDAPIAGRLVPIDDTDRTGVARVDGALVPVFAERLALVQPAGT